MKKLALLFLLFPIFAFAEPQIEQFFPEQPVLLGQPLFWIIKIRYPLWESYELKFSPCQDLKIRIDRSEFTEVAGEMRALHRISVAPTSLKVSCTPSIFITDVQGQTTVLNGKRLSVRTISGSSKQIRNPAMPDLSRKNSKHFSLLYVALALFAAAGLFLIGKRVHSNTPKQKLLRDIRKASAEVQKNRLPIQVWRLLRSEMIWGFSADPFTPSQLLQKAGSHQPLQEIAQTLQSLETWRYSGAKSGWSKEQVSSALGQAENMLQLKSRLAKRKAAA
jgi:hypothetical protein